MLFALSAPLIGTAMMTWKKIILKPFLVFLIALIIGMALLTASRMTALAIAMTLTPILLALTKRPVVTVVGMVVAAAGLSWIMSMAEDTAMERLGSLESQRTELWGYYLRDVFTRRPFFGLLGTGGESYFRSNIVGQHPHSAWFNLMYHGGLFLLIPMWILVGYSTYSGYKVWKLRKYLGGSPLIYSVMYMLLLAMYVQGCFNQVVFWPTYSWSFLHVVLAGLFIMVWREIRIGNINGALPSLSEQSYYEVPEEASEEFHDYANDGPALT
jgi:hypothetical protein